MACSAQEHRHAGSGTLTNCKRLCGVPSARRNIVHEHIVAGAALRMHEPNQPADMQKTIVVPMSMMNGILSRPRKSNWKYEQEPSLCSRTVLHLSSTCSNHHTQDPYCRLSRDFRSSHTLTLNKLCVLRSRWRRLAHVGTQLCIGSAVVVLA